MAARACGTRRPMRVALLAATLTLFAGCALLQRAQFRQPTAELATISVTSLSLSGGSVVLGLDVHNPNTYNLRSLEVRADLTVEQVHFGEALLSGATNLAPETVTRVEIPLRFTWEGVGAAARGLLTQGAVAYQLGGRILVETPLGERWVGLQNAGTASIFSQDSEGS